MNPSIDALRRESFALIAALDSRNRYTRPMLVQVTDWHGDTLYRANETNRIFKEAVRERQIRCYRARKPGGGIQAVANPVRPMAVRYSFFRRVLQRLGVI